MKTKTTLPDFRTIMDSAAKYIAEDKPKIGNPADVANIMRPLMLDKPQEEFWVLALDTRSQVIELIQVTIGLVGKSQINATAVFRPAMLLNAPRVILCHNHPSGDPRPSEQDIVATRALVNAGKILDIEVLDHVVMGIATPNNPKDFLSLRELNLMG